MMMLVSLFAIGVAVFLEQDAKALSTPLSDPRSYTVDCGTSVTRIVGGQRWVQHSYRCINISTTSVFVGGNNVTTVNGIPYCTTAASCPDGAGFGGDFKVEYCIVASGTVTLRCRSGSL